MALDRISNLEVEITQKILSYLPIKEAARTSLVSKNWRHKWTVLPWLVFDDENGLTSDEISHVLLLHSGSIDRFKLSSRKNLDDNDIDQWLQYLSLNSIKEIIVKKSNRYSSSYTISSNLYSCRDLIHLELSNCLLKPPSTLKGFGMLKSLRIQRVNVDKDVLEELISHSPQLEKISLCNLRGTDNLKIDAPNVQVLELRDGFDDVVLENTLNPVDVSIDRRGRTTNSSSMLKFLFSLPRIEKLTLEGFFLECANGSLPEKLTDPCLALKFLSISIRLNNLEDISTAMCLLRSSHSLQELEISVNKGQHLADDEEATCNWLNDEQNRAYTQLRVLRVTGFSCVKSELNFIVFLLLSSPALQQLEISCCRKVVEAEDYSWLFDNQKNIGAFMQLRLVKVTGLSGNKAEVNFIRFVLSSTSPMLERLTLQPAASAKALWELFKLLGEFINRVSEPADLEFLDPYESDNSSDSSDSDDDMGF